MNHIKTIHSFMSSIEYEGEKKNRLDLLNGKAPFITISRETGAGGHSLAESLVKKLSAGRDGAWQLCDQEICNMLEQDPKLSVSVQSLLDAEYHSQLEDIMHELFAGLSPQDTVLKKMFKLIRTLAACGRVVFVGRGANCVTESLNTGLHIRLVAPIDVRTRRMEDLLKVSSAEAREIITRQDKARAKLVKTFFNADIADPLGYDLVLNTARLSVDAMTDMVEKLMLSKKAVQTPAA